MIWFLIFIIITYLRSSFICDSRRWRCIWSGERRLDQPELGCSWASSLGICPWWFDVLAACALCQRHRARNASRKAQACSMCWQNLTNRAHTSHRTAGCYNYRANWDPWLLYLSFLLAVAALWPYSSVYQTAPPAPQYRLWIWYPL